MRACVCVLGGGLEAPHCTSVLLYCRHIWVFFTRACETQEAQTLCFPGVCGSTRMSEGKPSGFLAAFEPDSLSASQAGSARLV